jgi:hypothetical protein
MLVYQRVYQIISILISIVYAYYIPLLVGHWASPTRLLVLPSFGSAHRIPGNRWFKHGLGPRGLADTTLIMASGWGK